MIRVLLVTALMAFPTPSDVNPDEMAAAVARPAVVTITVTWHGWVRDKQTGEVFGGTKGYDARTRCGGAVIDPAGYIVTPSRCVHSGAQGGGAALFQEAIQDLTKVGRIGNTAKATQAFAERAVAEGAAPDLPMSRQIVVERKVPSGLDSTPATVVDLTAPTDGDVAVLQISRTRLPSLEIRPEALPPGAPSFPIGSGPIVDSDGRLVGLIGTGGRTTDVTVVSTLMKGLKPSLGAHDRNYRTGLERYFARSYDSAVDYFDAVVADSPTNLQAAYFREKAAAKGGSPNEGRDLTTLLAYIFGGVTLIAGGIGVWLVRRRAGSGRLAPPLPDPRP